MFSPNPDIHSPSIEAPTVAPLSERIWFGGPRSTPERVPKQAS